LNTTNDFWLIDSNFVGVMRFYKDRDNSDKSIDYMFIEEGIIMGIHGENPPLMKTKKKVVIEEARFLWQKLLSKKILFDYQFFSTGANSLDKKFLDFVDIKKSYSQSCLTFKVAVRGHCEKRAYEIYRKEGPLALLPLEKNLYQVIWTSSTLKAIERLNSDKNFLMDNLSTILPDEFKLDQIIGEFNIFPVSLSLNLPVLNFKKLVFVGDAFHTFHPVGGQGLNTCWRDVNTIYDLLNKNTSITKMQLILFKFKYFSSRILDIIVTIFITDLLISIFANRNLFLFPIRKFSFLLLNNFLFIRKLVLNQMTKSLIYSNIK